MANLVKIQSFGTKGNFIPNNVTVTWKIVYQGESYDNRPRILIQFLISF